MIGKVVGLVREKKGWEREREKGGFEKRRLQKKKFKWR